MGKCRFLQTGFYCINHIFKKFQPTSMSLTMSNNTDSSHVTATNNHGKISRVKLDEINDLASLDLQHNSVVHSNQRVRVADGAGIMSHKVWDTLCSCSYTSHLAKFVLNYQHKTYFINIDMARAQFKLQY